MSVLPNSTPINIDVIETADGPRVRQHPAIINKINQHNLKLGKSTTLICSNCGTKLVDILVTRPTVDIKAKFKAMCWKCGDHSFVEEISGGIHLGSTKESVLAHIHTDLENITILDTAENSNPGVIDG